MRVVGQKLRRILDVRLGDQQDRLDSGVVRSHQGAVDEAGARLRVGRGHHNHQLVRIGHDGPFHGIGIISAAAKEGFTVLDFHQPGQGVGVAGNVSHQRHEVACHHRVAAQLACTGGDDNALVAGVLAHHCRVAPTVYGDDTAGDGIVVAGPVLGPGPGAFFAGPDADIRLVPGVSAPRHRLNLPKLHWKHRSGPACPPTAGENRAWSWR